MLISYLGLGIILGVSSFITSYLILISFSLLAKLTIYIGSTIVAPLLLD
jgi:hypothetical protein